MRHTKIVGTMGPASSQREIFERIVEAGIDVVRFNFSHGNHEEHKKNMDMVKAVRQEKGKPIAILLDTKGPEIRVGTMKPQSILVDETMVVLTSGDFEGDAQRIPISYEELYQDVFPGSLLLISDGKILLRVVEVKDREIHAKVEKGGELTTRKGVNAPGIRVNLPAVTERDKLDIAFGIEEDVDFIAASFIRKASDVLEIRKILEDAGASDIRIISKIENREGLQNLQEILEVSDGIMVARGDLGMEMPIEELPMAQKRMIESANRAGKSVITATQMLESMTHQPLPTRAEATDVANAIVDGTDAIMLSGEMAAGEYPVESVMMMNRIATATEQGLDFRELFLRGQDLPYMDSITYAVSRATVESAMNLKAKAIVTATSSGLTARKLAMHRPSCPIIAGVTSDKVRRQLNLERGVLALPMLHIHSTDGIFKELEKTAAASGLVEEGDLIVVTCGIPIGVAGATNMMKIHSLGEITLKGVGIGQGRSTGILRFIDRPNPVFNEGDIAYTKGLQAGTEDYLSRASAIVTEEGGYTSAGALAGINFGIPALVGVRHAEEFLRDGMEVTVDAKLGIVSNGKKEFR